MMSFKIKLSNLKLVNDVTYRIFLEELTETIKMKLSN